MEIDPVDTLKRKRRSASPPPLFPSDTPKPESNSDGEPEVTPPSTKKLRSDSPPRRGRDARFRGLFNDAAPASTTDERVEDDDESPIKPSIHPATRALYISNLVRPLQEQSLKSHILSLASRNAEDPSDSLIERFYLDPIKSHALIVFESLTAANRVRVGIHDKVFPMEKNRKPLWADFVPEESVPAWIEKEEQSHRSIVRWDVVYEKVGDEMTAELVEVGAKRQGRMANASAGAGPGAGVARARGSVDISNAPSGPRGGSEGMSFTHRWIMQQAAESFEAAAQKTEPKKKIMNLDELFLSTKAKPKLYYLPVSESIAKERLDKQGRDPTGKLY